MCVTNKGFIHQVIEDWKADPTKFINANENDTPGKCVCAECMAADESEDEGRLQRTKDAYAKKDPAWYAELGSVTQRYCKFYMDLLEEGRKTNPD